jgi:hypothetical protein
MTDNGTGTETETETSTEPVETTEPSRAPEEHAAWMTAGLGLPAPGETSGTTDPTPGPRRTGRVAYLSPPERSARAALAPDDGENAAWFAYVDAVDRTNEAVTAIHELPAEEGARASAYRRAVADATRAGSPTPKAPKAVDAAMRHQELVGVYEGTRELHAEAKAAYGAAVAAALPAQASALLEAIALRHEEACQALDRAADAATAMARWQQTIRVATDAQAALGKPVPSIRRRPESPNPSALGPALAEARAAVESDDPALSGAFLQDDGLRPSRHQREEAFRSGGGALMELAALELREGFAHTSWTRNLGKQMSRAPMSVKEYEGLLAMSRKAR